MMRVLKFSLLAAFLIALIVILNSNQPFGSSLPPLGKLLNPTTGFWQNAESSAVPKQLKINNEELDGAVEVIFDQRLVPHIYASSNKDAAFVQGYLHAMHRLWQMDIATRAVGGRLSEVLGERTLGRDRLQKKKGFVYAAENALDAWMSSPSEAKMLNAYADGINAYIDQLSPKDYPLEFKILDYKPEAWSPKKSALFLKYMAESLCARHRDLPSTNARSLLGQEMFDFLYPEYNPKQLPIIPEDVEFDFDPLSPFTESVDSTLLGLLLPYEMFELPHEGNGSNNWAVRPEKSASGNPILCSDPHLGLTLPAIWYEAHIQTPTINAYGVSLPSEPGLVMGFNDNIAWGETNVGHDVLDWYTIDWTDETKTKYLLDGKEEEVEIRKDTIWVLGKKEHEIVETKYTYWGPIVYEDTSSQYMDLAMRWIAHDKPKEKPFYELGTFWGLMSADNHQEYKAALKGYDSPAQNFAFACKNGDVAITVNGNLPVKRDQQGRFIQDGSKSSNGWNGFIPRDQIPQVLNPERGWISSANQHSTDEDYPYYYNAGFDDYRGRSVNLRLDTMEQITIEDMKAMQTTSFGLYAKEFLEIILPMIDQSTLDKKGKEAFESLSSWDFYYKKDAIAPVIMENLDDSLYQLTFDEIYTLGEDQSMLFPENWRMLELIQSHYEHEIFDLKETEQRENASDIVNLAFQKMVNSLPEETDWSELNNASVSHMAGIAPFGHQGLDMDGNGLALNAIRGGHGPSWRMIVELGEEVNAFGVYPGGQSGNPGSAFYDNMVFQWANGEYNQLVFPKQKEDFPQEQVLFKMTFEK